MKDTPIWAYGILDYNVNLRSPQNNSKESVFLNNNSLIVSLEPSQECDGVQLSQSFDSNGLGCYTNSTPGQENAECITLRTSSDISIPNQFTLHKTIQILLTQSSL